VLSAASIPYGDLVFDRNHRGDRMELGRGAIASVFSASYRGEPVAVKSLVIPAGASPSLLTDLERVFFREAALMYHVRHDGVVPLLGAVIDRKSATGPPTELSLVMPRMPRNLDAALSIPTTDLPRRLQWLHQIARTLRFLHASGIVHGNLKPSNVLIDATGTRALICDIAHARLRDADRSSSAAAAAAASTGGGISCTPRYHDPAVSSGRSLLRKASDIYSFGILAWHVLAGRPPFDGMDTSAVLAHTAAGGRPDPDALPASVPGPLRVLLSRCWWENQNDRPTAAALVKGLEEPGCCIAGMGGGA
jgi:serine/threonine protein kinase